MKEIVGKTCTITCVTENISPTDEHIAEKVQRGDPELFGVLVERYEQKLLRYGRKFLRQREDIEDIVQDVFVSAYKNIQSFDIRLRFSPWIYRIAHNAFVNALRRNEYGVRFVDLDTLLAYHVVDDHAENERERGDMRRMLDAGMAEIALKYREVLTLHYFEDLPYKDIADILQVPIGTVSIRLKRAKEELKKHINHMS